MEKQEKNIIAVLPVKQFQDKNDKKKELLKTISIALFNHCFPKKDFNEKKKWQKLYGLPDELGTTLPYKKYQLDYIADYFSNEKSHNVATIVVEPLYLSPTFFNDYKNFYSSIFSPYDRMCSRLHFFGTEFQQVDFDLFLQDNQKSILNIETLRSNYLGFLVLRPLPEQIVGATLLKTYPEKSEDGTRRFFPARDYTINLFGIEIQLNSLVFTSQDKTVGACASYALWMCFHKTADLFKTQLPTPSEITRRAGKSSKVHHRTFPSQGLDPFQIANAIESIGLEPEYRISEKGIFQMYYLNDKGNKSLYTLSKKKEKDKGLQRERYSWKTIIDISLIKAHIYAYSRLGIPVLLGIQFIEGLHLITISGYKEDTASLPPNKIEEHDERLVLRSRRIKNLYCHDDNVGAFSRLYFCDDFEKIEDNNYHYGTIVTGWVITTPSNNPEQEVKDKTGIIRKRAQFNFLCTPLESLIRLSFEDVHSKVSWVDKVFDLFKDQIKNNSQDGNIDKIYPIDLSNLEWDIYLQKNKDYKGEVFASDDYGSFKSSKSQILTTNMSKYVWVAKGRKISKEQEELLIEMVFDSTETSTSYSCLIFNYSQKIVEPLARTILSIYLNEKADDKIKEFLNKIDELLSQVLKHKDTIGFIDTIVKQGLSLTET